MQDKNRFYKMTKIIAAVAVVTAVLMFSGLFTVYIDLNSYKYLDLLYLILSIICLVINISLGIYIFMAHREYAARYSVVWVVNAIICIIYIVMYFTKPEEFFDTVMNILPYHAGFNTYEALRATGVIKSSRWYGRRRWYRWFR